MVALAVSGLSALKRLYSVALFVSQLYVLSGRAGSLMTTEHSKQQFVSTKGVTSPSTNTPYTRATETTEIPSYDQRNNEVENFTINMTCQFCWQLEPTDYVCTNSTSCMTVSCPRQRYNATCTVRDHIHCLGNRVFPKMLYCNWTGGYKWSTALALSITLGGFGADRFYLGQWREGLGKLFSFGGLGIWTLIDVLLIGVGYVGPADGSLYI
ncbi:TM2 domain-containing protein 3 isoform X3 [Malaclemys terrapin pileata]|uniref:TM2 domain-containing protein 3 isoform X3 n=1 Tax=Malaclemys terrapin pileata TaxID=2991368 RepID=UPI0023A7A7A8|nr:TM2 domain-containing protein 3 isoform X3 [Malaclemys terrapin pileata]